MLYTTLKLLRKANACTEGMGTLTASLPSTPSGSKWSENKRIPLSHILESNGLNHAIWAMQATTVNSKQEIAQLAIKFASESLSNFEKQFPKDERPRQAIEAASLFMQGKITVEELSAARSAAWSAAWSAESAAWSAESAARSAARSAAWSARSAARSAESAAWSAAESAALKRQKDIFLSVIG